MGAPRAAAALKWGLGEWIHKGAPESGREAPLAIALLSGKASCKTKTHRGGDGPSFRLGPQIAVDAPVLVASVTA